VAGAERVNELDLAQTIRQGESMTVEFKSDRGPLADDDLIEAAELCRISSRQAGYLLHRMTERGALIRVGRGAATVYQIQ
jgi:predicted transcriptional regulator of viral defense system